MTLTSRFLAITSVLGLLCFAVQAQEKKISRAQLPPAVEQTVQRESEGATIKGFAKEVEHGQTFYEASLNVSGHNKDVLIDKNGKVVEVEEEVAMDSLPSTVQSAIKKAAGTGTIDSIESLKKNGKLVAYEAHVKRGKNQFEIQVGPNGEKLQRPE